MTYFPVFVSMHKAIALAISIQINIIKKKDFTFNLSYMHILHTQLSCMFNVLFSCLP